MTEDAPLLSVEGLAIGHGRRALAEGLAFELRAARVLCLLGPNGAGKTTLFRTLLGLAPALAGRVCFGGIDIATLSRSEIARRAALVPQSQGVAFPFTVEEVVLMGRTARIRPFAAPSAADREAAVAALRDLGMAEFRERIFNTLSGGERQLVLVARALAQDAPLVLLDEPTASLDLRHSGEVLAIIRGLADRGRGVVFSTHDPSAAFEVSEYTIAMGARKVFFGRTTDILTPVTLSEIYDVNVEILEVSGRLMVARI